VTDGSCLEEREADDDARGQRRDEREFVRDLQDEMVDAGGSISV
jgi:hypothetical protein